MVPDDLWAFPVCLLFNLKSLFLHSILSLSNYLVGTVCAGAMLAALTQSLLSPSSRLNGRGLL
jgi:hypothetical protein